MNTPIDSKEMFQKKPVSDRTVLTNIDESKAQSSEEKEFIQNYKQIYQNIIKIDKYLFSIRDQINELSNKSGVMYVERINKLKQERHKVNSLKNKCLQQLHSLEEQEMFRYLVDREKRGIYVDIYANEAISEQGVQEKQEEQNEESSTKEKVLGSLSCFGVIMFFLIRLIVSVLPFIMIDGSFFVTFLLIGIQMFLPFTTAIFWIWGLVCAINGIQDVFAIVYYIVFVVVWIPFYISTITSFFKNK